MLKAANESETQTLIDATLLEQEGIGYDDTEDVYYDLITGEVIDLQYIEDRLQMMQAGEQKLEDEYSQVSKQVTNLDARSRVGQ